MIIRNAIGAAGAIRWGGFLLLIFTVSLAAGQHIVDYRSGYKYLKGSSSQTISDWTTNTFDDANWEEGNAPFRYGDGEGGTLLSDMQNSYTTVFLRKKFNWTGGSSDVATLSFDYDDGFVLWINNKKIIERNAPVTLDKSAKAIALRESGVIESVSIDLDDLGLQEGENTLAVLCLNSELSSSDVYFDLEISSVQKLSDAEEANFSHPAGFYNQPFVMTLTPPAGYGLLYTLDGSNPPSSSSAIAASEAVNINVNPSSTANRAATAGFIVKASLTKPDYEPSHPVSKTYLFVSQVKNQIALSAPWPQTTNINGQRIDLDIDYPANMTYMDTLELALKDIPSISVSTDMSNLFDPASGIFVNASGHGPDWERPCSVELLNPDGSEGFEIYAGLRMRGGYSRNGSNPKHAFRLFFRGEYGEGKLNYPLFGEEGAQDFDKIDLRTSQNYAWAYDAGENKRNTLIRDVFSRDLQAEMGQPHSRSKYYHLYINGAYWGLFMTQERAEARFAESYFGGDKSDYDVIKVTTDVWPYEVEATDGSIDTWNRIYQLTKKGTWTDTEYFQVQGKDQNGNLLPDGEALVDIDNLIDYMMVIFYTGNCDAPVSSFSRDMANNFYLIKDRTDPTQGFRFMAHDSEHSMMYEPVYACSGLYENRVSLPMSVTSISNFHPQWLHYKLSGSPEYRLRFADRASKMLGENGLFTPERLQALFDARADQIDMAIIANAIRWGGAQVSPPRSKLDWLAELNNIRTRYFPYRTDIFKNQLINADLLTDFGAPQIVLADQVTAADHVDFVPTLSFVLKNEAGGVLYYTTDGTDPRLPGGGISTSATKSNVSVDFKPVSSMVIKARTKVVNDWGPMREFYVLKQSEDLSVLKISELHYHALDQIAGVDTISGNNFEFIELMNTSEVAINISGLTIDSAVYYQVPENTVLQPGASYVVAADSKYFFERYGMYANGVYERNLSNSGEPLVILNSQGNEIIDFTYSDKEPWPVQADGSGYSLVWSGLELQPADYRYWLASSQIHGNPFVYEPVEYEPLDFEHLAYLRINELQYHPLDGEENGLIIDEEFYEFIEIINSSTLPLNVSGVMIDSAITFTFPSNTILAPEEPYVIASNYERFRERYGVYPNGEFQKNLSNSGERLVLSAEGQVFIDFTYDDSTPWPELADGAGYSLTWNKMNFEPGDYRYWTLSSKVGGTPLVNEVIISGNEYQSGDFMVFPNPAKDHVTLKMAQHFSGNLTVTDLTGRNMVTQEVSGTEIIFSVGLLPKGTYIISLQNAQQQLTQLVIVE